METNDPAQKPANRICHQRKDKQEVHTPHIHLRAFKALSKLDLLGLSLCHSHMVVNIHKISQVHYETVEYVMEAYIPSLTLAVPLVDS